MEQNEHPYVILLVKLWQKKEKKGEFAKDQAAKDRSWKIPICYEDTRTIPLQTQNKDNTRRFINQGKAVEPSRKDEPKFSEDSRVRCFVPVHSSFLAFACH
ncbi:hypothetical protein Tco_0058204 [Tanacetum coccineum]